MYNLKFWIQKAKVLKHAHLNAGRVCVKGCLRDSFQNPSRPTGRIHNLHTQIRD